jgi:hypothetical protein
MSASGVRYACCGGRSWARTGDGPDAERMENSMLDASAPSHGRELISRTRSRQAMKLRSEYPASYDDAYLRRVSQVRTISDDPTAASEVAARQQGP